jgi:hypothetical protein
VNSINDDLKDTVYIEDEDVGEEEMTISRAIDNFVSITRFIQLLCENHNPDL